MKVISLSSNARGPPKLKLSDPSWPSVDHHWRHDHRANVHAFEHRREVLVAVRDFLRRVEQHGLGGAHGIRQRHAARHREAPPRIGNVGRQSAHRHEIESVAIGREHRDLTRRRAERWQTLGDDDARHGDRRQGTGERFCRTPESVGPIRRALGGRPRRLGTKDHLVALQIGVSDDHRGAHNEQ